MPPERRLDDWLDAFMDYNENSEPPRQFVRWTGIGVIAAALQRKCYMIWEKDIFPNMYICIIGPSGSKKGTAMNPGSQLLRAIGVEISAQSITPQQLIRRMGEVTDTTHDESNGDMIMHSSFTVFSEEFTVFLGFQNEELLSQLCDLYDCPNPFKHETKTQGQDEVVGAWLNIIGATTPSTLSSSLPLNAIGGGLTSRMLMIYGDKRYKRVSIPIKTKEELQLFETLKMDLEKINFMKGRFRFTEAFIKSYAEWYEGGESPPELTEHFAGYMSRRATHVRKLCMILSASRSNSMVIDECDFTRALKILAEAESQMNNVFMGVGQSQNADLIPRVMRFLAEKPETSYQDLMRRFYQDADRATMDKLLQTLDSMNYINIIQNTGMIRYKGPMELHEALKQT